MPDLKDLRLLDKMPALYRDVVDRRCRAASGYSGERPWADLLVDWGPDSPETAAIKRLTQSLADLDTKLATATELGDQGEALEKQRADMVAEIALSRQQRDYYDAYAGIADTIARHIDLRLIPLIDGLPEDLRAAGQGKADIDLFLYRLLLLHQDAPDLAVDEDELEYPVGIDAPVEPIGAKRYARRLRRDAGMAALHLGCLLGLIGKVGEDDHQLYAPDLLVRVSRDQDRRMWEWAKRHRLVERDPAPPEPGQQPFSKPLTEVIQNKLDARYATLWSLIKAIEQHAEREGLACLFVTMTLPPEYHPNPSHGGRSWNPALSPVRGAEELQDRWHRMLARARKAGVPVLGLWTLEPHKDGAPHRHAMIWLPPEHQAQFLVIVRDEFPDPKGQENVAATVKTWEQRPAGIEGAASPATYIVKYLVKTFMGGERFVDAAEQPDTDLQHLENPERVQAWRRGLGGKRMYDFFGLKRGAITIWDRIGKIPAEGEPQSEADQETLADPVFGAAHRAIKEHRGADALAILELVLYGPRPVDDAKPLAAASGPAVQILRAPVVDGEGRSVVRAVAIMSRSNGVIDLSPRLVVVPNPLEPEDSGGSGGVPGEAASAP